MKSLIEHPPFLYFMTFVMSLAVSSLLTPVLRWIALRLNILDRPWSEVKTHQSPTPYLGGLAIWSGWALSLFAIRFFTHFPTGTLHSLRGILIGSIIIMSLGLVDDIIPRGLGFKKKFLIQILAALLLIAFDIRLNFVTPYFMAFLLTVIWIVGITNAFNIVDIMDGLSSGIAFVASLAFLFISLPTEQIYVNFCAAALAGGLLGFIPYNLSKKRKIFMGDAGSLAIGFLLAAESLGTSYTKLNNIGVMAPLLILALPIYDTCLVSYLRIRKGQSPFLGSKDHFALRLEFMGFNRRQILALTLLTSAVLSFGAFLVTRLPILWALGVFVLSFILALITSYRLGQVEIK